MLVVPACAEGMGENVILIILVICYFVIRAEHHLSLWRLWKPKRPGYEDVWMASSPLIVGNFQKRNGAECIFSMQRASEVDASFETDR